MHKLAMKLSLFFLAGIWLANGHLEAGDLSPAIAQLRSVSDATQSAAIQAAWREIADAEIEQLVTILSGIKDASPLAENWLRSACDAVVERHLQDGGKLPVDDLRAFVLDFSQAPRARQAAYEWLVEAMPTAPSELLPKMLNDPSLDLRFDAVEHLLRQVPREKEGEQKIAVLERALDASRDYDQITGIVKQLEKLERSVDLTKHFGFVTEWHTIGPFDIADGEGFEIAYPPEQSVDLKAKCTVEQGEIGWTKFIANGQRGELNFIEGFGKTATGVMYAVATFDSSQDQPAEIRYESSNGTKLWLNGEPVAENKVYHSGSAADQYIVPVNLREGENTILLKICQTKRSEDWAHLWSFRLRVSDALGGAIRQAGE